MENKSIEKLNASQLERYRTKNKREIAALNIELESLLIARREADKEKVYTCGQFPEDLRQEILLRHKMKVLTDQNKAIEERLRALQKPKTPQEATLKVLRRLNQGHQKQALKRSLEY